MLWFPYASLSLEGHFSGEMEVSYYGEPVLVDVFDEDDMGDDGVFERFQIGSQINATLNIDKFNVGLSYGTDFMEMSKNVDTKALRVSVGVNF